ncbi:MAG: hypothetical protein VX017_05415, partial [Pseudomonadota bacterium]|nr:hypothetical protein [Pseudomonadota bacterium]
MNNVAMIIGKRLGLGVLTMFMVSIIIFLAVNMLPGDFAQALLGQSATPEAVAAIRKDLGLDMHTDNSDVTFNVCLGRDFDGAGLAFCGNMGSANHRHFTYTH